MSALAVLIDTDVLLDFLTERGVWTKNAKEIIQLSRNRKINAFLAAHSIPNIFYILCKIYSVSERKQCLLDVCQTVSIVEIGYKLILNALVNNAFTDFEDCLQAECAKAVHAEYIITHNISDYAHSGTPAILPETFLKNLHA